MLYNMRNLVTVHVNLEWSGAGFVYKGRCQSREGEGV